MNQLKSSYSEDNYQHIVSEYSQNLRQAMIEIKKAIHLLEEPDESLSHKFSSVQEIMTKTVNNLQDLENKTEQILSEVNYEQQQAA